MNEQESFNPLAQARLDAQVERHNYYEWVGKPGEVTPEAAADMVTYLEGRPASLDSQGRLHAGNGKFMSAPHYEIDDRGRVINTSIEAATLAENDYESMGMVELSRRLGQAELNEDKTTTDNILDVLLTKVDNFAAEKNLQPDRHDALFDRLLKAKEVYKAEQAPSAKAAELEPEAPARESRFANRTRRQKDAGFPNTERTSKEVKEHNKPYVEAKMQKLNQAIANCKQHHESGNFHGEFLSVKEALAANDEISEIMGRDEKGRAADQAWLEKELDLTPEAVAEIRATELAEIDNPAEVGAHAKKDQIAQGEQLPLDKELLADQKINEAIARYNKATDLQEKLEARTDADMALAELASATNMSDATRDVVGKQLDDIFNGSSVSQNDVFDFDQHETPLSEMSPEQLMGQLFIQRRALDNMPAPTDTESNDSLIAGKQRITDILSELARKGQLNSETAADFDEWTQSLPKSLPVESKEPTPAIIQLPAKRTLRLRQRLNNYFGVPGNPELAKERRRMLWVPIGLLAVGSIFGLLIHEDSDSKKNTSKPDSTEQTAPPQESSSTNPGTGGTEAPATETSKQKLSGAGDSIWAHARQQLVTQGNTAPNVVQIDANKDRILQLNNKSEEDARRMTVNDEFKV